MHVLLTELQSNQKNTNKMFTEKEMLYWSIMKRQANFEKFGCSDIAAIIGLTIRFIDSDQILNQ